MTDRELVERVRDLRVAADRARLPGHRHTADRCLEDLDELRSGLRRLERDLGPASANAPRYPRRPVSATGVITGRDPRSGVVIEVRRRRPTGPR